VYTFGQVCYHVTVAYFRSALILAGQPEMLSLRQQVALPRGEGERHVFRDSFLVSEGTVEGTPEVTVPGIGNLQAP
jgi:hypothetical protein